MANAHTTLSGLFSAIANAIRGKTGGTDSLVADSFPDAIGGIVTLAEGSADATAGAANIQNGFTAYAQGTKVTGTARIPTLKGKMSDADVSGDVRKVFYTDPSNSLVEWSYYDAIPFTLTKGAMYFLKNNGYTVGFGIASSSTRLWFLNCGTGGEDGRYIYYSNISLYEI